jgi:hypothetical protein
MRQFVVLLLFTAGSSINGLSTILEFDARGLLALSIEQDSTATQ